MLVEKYPRQLIIVEFPETVANIIAVFVGKAIIFDRIPALIQLCAAKHASMVPEYVMLTGTHADLFLEILISCQKVSPIAGRLLTLRADRGSLLPRDSFTTS